MSPDRNLGNKVILLGEQRVSEAAPKSSRFDTHCVGIPGFVDKLNVMQERGRARKTLGDLQLKKNQRQAQWCEGVARDQLPTNTAALSGDSG